MPPEQWIPDSRLDQRADIYALGCVVVEMLTGIPPFASPDFARGSTFRAGDVDEVYRLHLTRTVDDVLRSVAPPYRRLIEVCLAKDSSERIESFDKLADELATTYRSLFGVALRAAAASTSFTATDFRHRGQSFAAMGRAAEAVHEFSKSLRIHPNDAEALARRGLAYARLGEYPRAFRDERRAAEMDPDGAFILATVGGVFGLVRRTDDAKLALQRALDASPTSHWIAEKLAAEFLRGNELDDAISMYTNAITLSPTCAYSLAERGYARFLQQSYEAALTDLSEACRLQPDERSHRARRAATLGRLGRAQEALAEFDLALGTEPTAWALAERALILRELERYDDALTDLNRALEIEPQHYWARMERANIYRLTDQTEREFEDWSTVVSSNHTPEAEWARIGLAVAMWRRGRYLDALSAVIELARTVESTVRNQTKSNQLAGVAGLPEHGVRRLLSLASREEIPQAEWHEAAGRLHAMVGETDEAVRHLTAAVALDPDSESALRHLAIVATAATDFDVADSCYQRVLARNPDDIEIRIAMARNLAAMGNHDAAISTLSTAIGHSSRDDQLIHARGSIYESLGQLNEAFADYIDAVQSSSDPLMRETALLDCGAVLNAVDRPSDAIGFFGAALSVNPRSALAFNNRGNAYHYLGDYSRAIVERTRAISLNRTFRLAYFNRGNSYWEAGRLSLAVADYERAIQLHGDLDPKFVIAAHLRCAEYLHNVGRAAQASEHLADARRLQSERSG